MSAADIDRAGFDDLLAEGLVKLDLARFCSLKELRPERFEALEILSGWFAPRCCGAREALVRVVLKGPCQHQPSIVGSPFWICDCCGKVSAY